MKKEETVLRCKACGKIFHMGDPGTLSVRTGNFNGSPLWSPACCEQCAESVRSSAVADLNHSIEQMQNILDEVKQTPFRRFE